ncbi:SurA N-terminal domain-containing protein [Salinicoccus halodurans]|uniref:peptidylprolyl isomerase n=1 Tax=Salinicoccus halodurans TaxID=407035 RepID=A0A0F7HHY1_9STAP|nr:SurA N-terminal domain-containing protein [Salinicoccus halodurans]AKG73089.1 peptidylprolyl isomerase [Salinicoccus halodurans]SFK85624.1 peptidyl-prolyl cis-trans isomerase SurA [Salinicoccus halodurans]
MKKWLTGLSIASSMLVLGACDGGDDSGEDTGNAENQQESQEQTASGSGEKGGEGQQQEMPEPDMEGVPDVVAEVNGEEVTKDEFKQSYEGQFQQAAMQQQMSGQKVDQDELKKQVANGMVSQELLTQETENRGIEAPEDEVNKTLDDIVKKNQMKSQDEFFAAMEEQGMKKDEVMSQLETQVKMDKLIAEETGEIEPSDDELQKIYDQQKEQMSQMQGEEGGGEMPSFEEVKPQLKEQVIMQKQGEAAQKLAGELKEKSDVKVNL